VAAGGRIDVTVALREAVDAQLVQHELADVGGVPAGIAPRKGGRIHDHRVVQRGVGAEMASVGVGGEPLEAVVVVARHPAHDHELVLVARAGLAGHGQPGVGLAEPAAVARALQEALRVGRLVARPLPVVEGADDPDARGVGMVQAEEHAAVGEHLRTQAGEPAAGGHVRARLPRQAAQDVGRRRRLRCAGLQRVEEGVPPAAPDLARLAVGVHHPEGAERALGIAAVRSPVASDEAEAELVARELRAVDRPEDVLAACLDRLRRRRASEAHLQPWRRQSQRIVVVQRELERHVAGPELIVRRDRRPRQCFAEC
jgi:hypothetical protein